MDRCALGTFGALFVNFLHILARGRDNEHFSAREAGDRSRGHCQLPPCRTRVVWTSFRAVSRPPALLYAPRPGLEAGSAYALLFGRPPEHLVEQRKASSHSSRPTLLAELSLDASAHAGPVSLADPRRWNGLGR